MPMSLVRITVGGMVLTVVGGLALAQDAALSAPPRLVTTPAAIDDLQQFPSIRGEIERLTLTARGAIDGFILKDGTEVKTPPNLSMQIASALNPGDQVTIHGLKAAALPLMRAMLVTEEVSHHSFSDIGLTESPRPPVPRPPHSAGKLPQEASTETSGRVRMALHGPQGEVNGVLLEGGASLRFPPDQAAQFTALIQPHQLLVAEGTTITNSLGTVVDVQQLGASRDHLVVVRPRAHAPDNRGPGVSGAPNRPPLPPAPQSPFQPPPPPVS